MRATEISDLSVELQVIFMMGRAVCSWSESEQGWVYREMGSAKTGAALLILFESVLRFGAIRGSRFGFQ